ncbi:MAG: hypothetical protein FJ104_09915 [Deltaproteobacteria bacterium]|nr:hypothetical protein [Deltaproteobacteria bacterium]
MASLRPRPGNVRTLRHDLEERHAAGRLHDLREVVGIVVPLAVELARLHEAGETFHVHPGSIAFDPDGDLHLSPRLAKLPPEHPRDQACMPPELRSGHPGNARASVFSIGALLYELCTGEHVGPGMRRPTDVDPSLPPALDEVLAKALVGDPAHRPDDLKALAQAIHHLEPLGSMAPPPADESHLDHGEGFDVDVSLSMVPPMPRRGADGTDRTSVQIISVERPNGLDQATNALQQLKVRLESDPRPRYVVVKGGMDHGPFNAVELLLQIANHTFEEDDVLRDTISGNQQQIRLWEEFAPFAEHARRHRVIAAEKVAIEHSVEAEKRGTRGKAMLGVSAVGLVLVGGAIWFLARAGTRDDDVAVQADSVTAVEAEGNLNVPSAKGGKGGGRRITGEQGGIPILAGGMSCEAAQAAYVEEIKMGGGKVAPDITGAQYASVLNTGSYLNGCGLPSSAGVDVCVAVQNGRAVGVTVRTSPPNAGAQSCISGRLRGMSFPSHPKLDVTRTTFAPQ